MSAATLEEAISQLPLVFISEKTLEDLEKKFRQKTTELEWKDILNCISDFKKSHSKEETRKMVKRTARKSSVIETFYYLMVVATPVEDRTGKLSITIPSPPPVRKLDPNTVFPDFLEEDVKAFLLRLPFEPESNLEWEDLLMGLEIVHQNAGNTKLSFQGAFDELRSLDQLFTGLEIIQMEHAKDRLKAARNHRSSSTSSSSSTSTPGKKLNPDTVFPDFLEEDVKALLLRLPFESESNLKWDDLLFGLEIVHQNEREMKVSLGGSPKLSFEGAFDKLKTLDQLFTALSILQMEHAKDRLKAATNHRSSSSPSSPSSTSTPGKKLNPHLAFPSYYQDSTKLLIQHLFEKNESGLKWENVLLAMYDLGKQTGPNDILAGKLANDSKNIEKFYKKVIVCTPATARNTDLFSTPFNPYSNLSTFSPIPEYFRCSFPESFTEETKKLLIYLHCYHNPTLSNFETVLSAVRNSKKEDAYINALLKKCLTMDEFYDWIVSHYSQDK
jgi:hypothetical protein